jgi:POT family proton-dependent oligopeptide transporter
MEVCEICVVPTAIAATSKLSPAAIASTMMGVLNLAGAMGEFLAVKIGALMSVPKDVTDPVKTLPYYRTIFGRLALLSVAVAVFFLILYPLLKKWMQEVR